jgi:hypothetical protein
MIRIELNYIELKDVYMYVYVWCVRVCVHGVV